MEPTLIRQRQCLFYHSPEYALITIVDIVRIHTVAHLFLCFPSFPLFIVNSPFMLILQIVNFAFFPLLFRFMQSPDGCLISKIKEHETRRHTNSAFLLFIL